MHKFPYKTPKSHLLMHKNASKNGSFGPVISRCFLHYLYTSPQTFEISMVRGILIFFHFTQHHPLRLSNALSAPPKMHQNAVFGALVGGFMHKFPDSGSVSSRQVPKTWHFVVFRPVSGSAHGSAHRFPLFNPLVHANKHGTSAPLTSYNWSSRGTCVFAV